MAWTSRRNLCLLICLMDIDSGSNSTKSPVVFCAARSRPNTDMVVHVDSYVVVIYV